MDIKRLVGMVNDIARFYTAEPDREVALDEIAEPHHALLGSADAARARRPRGGRGGRAVRPRARGGEAGEVAGGVGALSDGLPSAFVRVGLRACSANPTYASAVRSTKVHFG
jgi:hypothetical protein